MPGQSNVTKVGPTITDWDKKPNALQDAILARNKNWLINNPECSRPYAPEDQSIDVDQLPLRLYVLWELYERTSRHQGPTWTGMFALYVPESNCCLLWELY
jgi:hypothetical protein